MEQATKLKRKAADGSCAARKTPRVEGKPTAEMNTLYRSAEFQEKITEAWRNEETLNDAASGMAVYSQPYQLCVLPGFISSGDEPAFLNQLTDEVLRLKFVEKNNDLYQFRQSQDLKKFKSPCIAAFRHILSSECLPWLRQVTGIELDCTIDITCSKYEFTDNLLCHDDQLEGRRIAFIFYLVPDWTAEDGGSLDLFNVDVSGEPSRIVKSIPPVWNNFIFFEVTPVSFHQVSEVLSASKTRLSISGWFHGPDTPRPASPGLPKPVMSDPIIADLSILSDWVSPCYLDIGTHGQIQSQFETDSQIELPDFLLEDKYKMMSVELESGHCKWALVGPPNRRRVHVAEKQSLPPVTTAFVEFLHSEPLCRLLSHLTGLDLAEDVIRPNAAFDEEPCSSASGGCEYSVGVYGNGSSKEEDIEGVGEEETKLSDGSRKLPPAASSTSSSSCPDISVSKNSKLGPSSSIPDNDLGHKLNCTNAPAAPSHKDQASGVVTRQEQHHETHHHCHSAAAAKVRGELLCFQPGDYTLVSDQDPTIAECALDLMLHFSCNGWSPDHGGMRVYVAKDEDEELLSVSPLSNALSLIYRDQDTISFTKYINHRSGCTDSGDVCSTFFTTAFTYQEKSPSTE